MTVYTIREFESFCEKGKNKSNKKGIHSLPSKTFKELEEFILSNKNDSAQAIELMGISAKKDVGKVITAKNYVGVIKMNSGETIEILPKIYSKIKDDENAIKTKRLVVKMLRTVKNMPFKQMKNADISTDKMNVLEIFIRMFIEETFSIVKKGIKSSYETVEENLNVYKGKLIFSQHVRHNAAHKERCYVEYDVFTVNRAENRLLKSTLKYLYRCSSSLKNKNDIKSLLEYFTGVDESKNYDADFSKCVKDRSTKDYENALTWSKVFLNGKSFTSFSGSAVSAALLFPMEILYESYVAALLKKRLAGKQYDVHTQHRAYSLFDEFSGRERDVFPLIPDIVVKKKFPENRTIIMDTKWKILDKSIYNYGISQADMYQMFVYSIKYNANKIFLLYPKTDLVNENKLIEYKATFENVDIEVQFIDLFDEHESIDKLIEKIKAC